MPKLDALLESTSAADLANTAWLELFIAPDHAWEVAEDALTRAALDHDDHAAAWAELVQAFISLRRSEPHTVVDVMHSLIRRFAKLGDQHGVAAARDGLALAWIALGKGLDAYDQMASVQLALAPVRHPRDAAMTFNWLGRVHYLRNEIEFSLRAHYQALQLIRAFGDEGFEAQMLCNLGTAQYHLGNLTEARYLLDEAAVQVNRRRLEWIRPFLHGTLACCHLLVGQPAAGLEQLKKLEALPSTASSRSVWAFLAALQAYGYAAEERWQDAEAAAAEAVAALQPGDDVEPQLFLALARAQVARSHRRFAEARRLLQAALRQRDYLEMHPLLEMRLLEQIGAVLPPKAPAAVLEQHRLQLRNVNERIAAQAAWITPLTIQIKRELLGSQASQFVLYPGPAGQAPWRNAVARKQPARTKKKAP